MAVKVNSAVVTYDLSIKDKSEPDSLISRLPTVLSERLNVIPNSILELSDTDLRKSGKLGVDEERLRISMWQEYYRACDSNRSMTLNNIYEGICSREHLLRSVIMNSYSFAYLCRPPLNLAIAAEEALLLGIEQVRDILSQPHVDAQGKFNASLGKLKLDAYKELHARVKGMVVQKIESKSAVVHVDAQPKSVDEINQRLAELESKANPQIDITPTIITEDA